MKKLLTFIGQWLCRHGWHKNVPYIACDSMPFQFTVLEVEVCKRCELIQVVGIKLHTISTHNS